MSKATRFDPRGANCPICKREFRGENGCPHSIAQVESHLMGVFFREAAHAAARAKKSTAKNPYRPPTLGKVGKCGQEKTLAEDLAIPGKALTGAATTLRLYPSGTSFSPFDPRPEDIHIEDVAHALALTNRFGGHVAEPYSVAQHSLIVAGLCLSLGVSPLWGLLHEVAEALSGLGDVCGPTKRHPLIRGPVKELERRIEQAAAIRFGLPEDFARSPGVKRADRIAYTWEDRDLRGLTTDDAWTKPLLEEVPAIRLVPMGWRDAESAFLDCFKNLYQEPSREVQL